MDIFDLFKKHELLAKKLQKAIYENVEDIDYPEIYINIDTTIKDVINNTKSQNLKNIFKNVSFSNMSENKQNLFFSVLNFLEFKNLDSKNFLYISITTTLFLLSDFFVELRDLFTIETLNFASPFLLNKNKNLLNVDSLNNATNIILKLKNYVYEMKNKVSKNESQKNIIIKYLSLLSDLCFSFIELKDVIINLIDIVDKTKNVNNAKLNIFENSLNIDDLKIKAINFETDVLALKEFFDFNSTEGNKINIFGYASSQIPKHLENNYQLKKEKLIDYNNFEAKNFDDLKNTNLYKWYSLSENQKTEENKNKEIADNFFDNIMAGEQLDKIMNIDENFDSDEEKEQEDQQEDLTVSYKVEKNMQYVFRSSIFVLNELRPFVRKLFKNLQYLYLMYRINKEYPNLEISKQNEIITSIYNSKVFNLFISLKEFVVYLHNKFKDQMIKNYFETEEGNKKVTLVSYKSVLEIFNKFNSENSPFSADIILNFKNGKTSSPIHISFIDSFSSDKEIVDSFLDSDSLKQKNKDNEYNNIDSFSITYNLPQIPEKIFVFSEQNKNFESFQKILEYFYEQLEEMNMVIKDLEKDNEKKIDFKDVISKLLGGANKNWIDEFTNNVSKILDSAEIVFEKKQNDYILTSKPININFEEYTKNKEESEDYYYYYNGDADLIRFFIDKILSGFDSNASVKIKNIQDVLNLKINPILHTAKDIYEIITKDILLSDLFNKNMINYNGDPIANANYIYQLITDSVLKYYLSNVLSSITKKQIAWFSALSNQNDQSSLRINLLDFIKQVVYVNSDQDQTNNETYKNIVNNLDEQMNYILSNLNELEQINQKDISDYEEQIKISISKFNENVAIDNLENVNVVTQEVVISIMKEAEQTIKNKYNLINKKMPFFRIINSFIEFAKTKSHMGDNKENQDNIQESNETNAFKQKKLEDSINALSNFIEKLNEFENLDIENIISKMTEKCLNKINDISIHLKKFLLEKDDLNLAPTKSLKTSFQNSSSDSINFYLLNPFIELANEYKNFIKSFNIFVDESFYEDKKKFLYFDSKKEFSDLLFKSGLKNKFISSNDDVKKFVNVFGNIESSLTSIYLFMQDRKIIENLLKKKNKVYIDQIRIIENKIKEIINSDAILLRKTEYIDESAEIFKQMKRMINYSNYEEQLDIVIYNIRVYLKLKEINKKYITKIQYPKYFGDAPEREKKLLLEKEDEDLIISYLLSNISVVEDFILEDLILSFNFNLKIIKELFKDLAANVETKRHLIKVIETSFNMIKRINIINNGSIETYVSYLRKIVNNLVELFKDENLLNEKYLESLTKKSSEEEVEKTNFGIELTKVFTEIQKEIIEYFDINDDILYNIGMSIRKIPFLMEEGQEDRLKDLDLLSEFLQKIVFRFSNIFGFNMILDQEFSDINQKSVNSKSDGKYFLNNFKFFAYCYVIGAFLQTLNNLSINNEDYQEIQQEIEQEEEYSSKLRLSKKNNIKNNIENYKQQDWTTSIKL